MLKITNLHAHIESENLAILRGVDLAIKPGELHVLLGPNGSGKSTLGRVLLGDEKYAVTEGAVTLGDADLLELESHERAAAGYFLSFQSPPAVDGVSLNELLTAAKKAQSETAVSAFRFQKELKQHLAAAHLSDDFAERGVNAGASGGERRKGELVHLLALTPQVAFLDEIDSGIDVDGLHAVAAGLRQFLADGTRSVVLVSHGQALLNLLNPTHAHVLVRGQVVASGGTEIITQVHEKGFAAWGLGRA